MYVKPRMCIPQSVYQTTCWSVCVSVFFRQPYILCAPAAGRGRGDEPTGPINLTQFHVVQPA